MEFGGVAVLCTSGFVDDVITFSIMGPVAQASKLKVTHQVAAPDRSGQSLTCMIALLLRVTDGL